MRLRRSSLGDLGVWHRITRKAGVFFLLGRLFSLQFVLDHLLDRGVRLVAGKKASVDEHGRRSGDSHSGSFLDIFLDRGDLPARINALVELLGVELEIYGALFQIGDAEFFLIAEHGIMKFPEALLFEGTQRGFRSLLSMGMNIGQRELAVHYPNFAGIVLFHFFKRWEESPAKRALEVGKLYNRYGGVIRA